MSKKNRIKARDRGPLTAVEAFRIWDTLPSTTFGTELIGDTRGFVYAERRNRCYELAGAALALGTAPWSAILVHGTWQGPGVDRPIGHAWLLLPDRQVWEPISGNIVPADVWQALVRPVAEVTYTRAEVRLKAAETEHWGCWHATTGAVANPELLPNGEGPT